jgi:NAD(P)-dependent dehydrogenase (short-subunit alcohol dehydrogenase family)
MWSDPSTWRVLVTGGSSGLGAATCDALCTAGAQVISLDRQPSSTIETIGVDLADTRLAEEATGSAIERLGALDALVCCAGIDVPGPFTTIDRETWERILAVNLLGMAAVTRIAMPALADRSGRVVTVASTLGHRAVGDATAYCASKFGVVGFTRALAAECRDVVGVTLLTPGGMRTPFFDGRSDQYRPGPDARLAEPAEIAAAVVWVLARPIGVEVKELVIAAPSEPSWP